ncbi:MAG TPA: DUF1176 domain-containing protein [Acidocella sp.]|nr:DUF1176 domain-containing protein [Acidocella sp.]
MKIVVSLFALLSLFAVGARADSSPVQSAAPSYDQYKDWLVACDNSLNCEAKVFGSDDNDDAGQLTLTRAGGADGALKVEIAAGAALGARGVRLDGQPLTLGEGWKASTSDGVTTLDATSYEVVRQLIEAARNGQEIELAVVANAGGGVRSIPLSLHGFSAALLRMDARQGRVGTETALLNPGTQPARAVPPAPPMPLVPWHPITAQLAPGEDKRLIDTVTKAGTAVLEHEQCDASQDSSDFTPSVFALGTKQALVLIPCIEGAYQGSYVGFIAGRADRTQAELKLSTPMKGNDASDQSTTMLTEADFDPKTGMLSMFAKGRGLGDCGEAASWIWEGTRFVLSSLTYQDNCGGVMAGDWPVLFDSRQN